MRAPVGTDAEGNVTIGIKGLIEPPTDRAREICEKDMHDLMATAYQEMDRRVLSSDTAPEVATQLVLTDIIERRYETLDAEEAESVRQHLAAHMNVLTLARREAERGFAEGQSPLTGSPGKTATSDEDEEEAADSAPNTLLQMVKKFINVRDIDVELIDSVNTFRERFEVASKSLNSELLAHVQSAMVALRVNMTGDEARTLWPRIKAFRASEGREPNVHSADPLEKRMAEALAWLKAEKAKRLREGRVVMARPSLDDIFAEDDEFGLLDVKLRGSRAPVASDQGAGALREVSAFFEKHGRVPDPDATDHDEMRLGSIWASIKSAPTDKMRSEDRFGLLDDKPTQALKSWPR